MLVWTLKFNANMVRLSARSYERTFCLADGGDRAPGINSLLGARASTVEWCEDGDAAAFGA